MKRLLLALFALLLSIAFETKASANPITRQQAQKSVQSFLEKKGKLLDIPMESRAAIKDQDWSNTDSYYIFNIGDNEGFVIAAGDDCVPAILGYSDSGSVGEDIPDNMKAWLAKYVDQITYMQELGLTSNLITSNNPAISPLLTTTWDQDEPYNQNCPDFFTYGKCVTGCVATAMAQVMYYHRAHSIQQTTTEIPAYECKKRWKNDNEILGRITVNAFPAGSVIDWDNMLDSYSGTTTETQQQAVANLMAYCGASVNMDYRNSWNGGSGAYSEDVPVAMKKYFDYHERMSLLSRNDYTEEQWDSLIYAELDKGNPIYYSGTNNSAGHAFVCDGYDGEGYYHINWGWSGRSDGFFLLSVLDPKVQGSGGSSAGYSLNQHALIGAIPNGEVIRLTTEDLLLTGNTMFSIEQYSENISVPIRLILTNLTDNSNDFDNAIGVYLKGNLVNTIPIETTNNVAVNGQITLNTSLNLSTEMADGVYQLKPMSKMVGAEEWETNGNTSTYFITLVIRNNTMKLCVGKPQTTTEVILFADAEVKRLCVDNWDLDGDEELSYDEAAEVTDLGTVFKSNTKITSFNELQFFSGLTSIGQFAFWDCENLLTIVIPSNVTLIGASSFNGCESLYSINFPDNLETIGYGAFGGCSSIESIYISSKVTSIGNSAFNDCSSIESIIVEEGNTIYDSRNNCNAIIKKSTDELVVGCKNSIIPDDVKIIGERAFDGCSGLASLTIPNSVTRINYDAFADCSGLLSLIIPSSVTYIHELAFPNCSGLESITVDTDNTIFDSRNNCNAIIRTSTNTLVLGCKNTIIPNNVIAIGSDAFWGCIGLESLKIPYGVSTIGSYAFAFCGKLLSSVGISSIYIPSSVSSIGENAFEYCYNLTSVKVGMKSPVSITSNTFTNRKKATLYVPQGCLSAYESADYWSEFKTIEEYDPTITFADAEIKRICVENWDTDNDGELSYDEAEAVTDLGTAFKENTKIESFDELQNFTGLTSIGAYSFSGCSNLLSVTIPSNVLSIDERAFRYCRKLSSITIPSSVTSIGTNAFYECSSLQTIDIPSSVTSIGAWAFAYCQGLASVNIPTNLTTINNYVYYHCTNLNAINIPHNVTSIYRQAFAGCSSLETITVEEGNTIYDSRNNCNAIIQKSNDELILGCKNTIIPNEVKCIGSHAFNGCTGLSSLTIPNQVNSINNDAFYNCSGLTSLSIPSGVSSIGNYSFYGCSGLTSIVVEEGNSVFDSRNNCNAIIRKSDETLVLGCKNTVIPLDVVSIGPRAFYGCSSMESINIPGNITSIGASAFFGCIGLTTIKLTSNITSIGNDAFLGCTNITEVKVGMKTPVTIGQYVFSNRSNATLYVPLGSQSAYEAADYWSGFKSIEEYDPIIHFADENVKTICVDNWDLDDDGELSYEEAEAVTDLGTVFHNNYAITSFDELQFFTGLQSIPQYAFDYCKHLSSIVFPDNIETIGRHAFELCTNLMSITIPSYLTSIDSEAFIGCSGLNSITVDEDNLIFNSHNNCNAIIRTSDNTLILGCNSTVIPNDVVSIGEDAFSYSGLTSLTIPNSVVSIGNSAFSGCHGLTSIIIPSSVSTIDRNPFGYCDNLSSISVEEGNPIFDSRNNCNAVICTSDNKVIVGCKNTVIPSSVTSIGNSAFSGCDNLTTIMIPNNVTSIGNSAFRYSENLKTVIISGSNTSVGDNAFYWCDKLSEVKVGMKTPVTITKNVFSNRANATLYVPYGCKAAYEAADYWNEFMEIVEVIEPDDVSSIDNVIYIEPMEEMANRQAVISLKMKNTEAIRGFQFDLYLPDGVTAARHPQDNTRFLCSLSNGRRTDWDEHTLTVSEQSNGSIRFLCGSQYIETFMGNDGEIATITVDIASDMEDGVYPIILRNVKLSESDIDNYYETALVSTSLTIVSYTLGDISGDGNVDVSDYIGVANHIMGSTPTGFIEAAADVNKDNNIDVSDYIGIANLILTGSIYGNSNNNSREAVKRVYANANAADNVIYVSPFSITTDARGTQVQLPIKMKNSAAIRGFQFDLYLPDGVTAARHPQDNTRFLCSLSNGRRTDWDEHTLTLNEQGDGAIRFLCGSQYDETFTGNDGVIATLRVNIDNAIEEGIYPIYLRAMKLTETDISNFYETSNLETTMIVRDPSDTRTILYETSTAVPETASNANVRVIRKLNADEWSTICLPFAMTETQLKTAFGNDVQLGDFDGCDVDGDKITVKFTDATAIAANHPYIIKVLSAISEFEVEGVDITPDAAVVNKDENNSKYNSFIGIYENGTTLVDGSIFLSGNQFYFSNGKTKMKALRGYFKFDAADAGYESRMAITFEETTGVKDIKYISTDKVYNLSGQQVKAPKKGIYVKDGKKVIIK